MKKYLLLPVLLGLMVMFMQPASAVCPCGPAISSCPTCVQEVYAPVCPPKVVYHPKIIKQSKLVSVPKMFYTSKCVMEPQITYRSRTILEPRMAYETYSICEDKLVYEPMLCPTGAAVPICPTCPSCSTCPTCF